MPVSPSGRSCFPRRLVNGDAFHNIEHLPPASSRPPALRILGRLHRGDLPDTFRPRQPFCRTYCSGLGPRGLRQPQPAKLVWTRCRFLASAITRKAGHTERTTEPHTALRFQRLATPKPVQESCARIGASRAAREFPKRIGAGLAGRSRPSQHARGGNRGQLEFVRTPPCRRATQSRSWRPLPGFTRPRLPSSLPHERYWPSERPGALSTARDSGRSASPDRASPSPPPR
jgi:hypothetical protein